MRKYDLLKNEERIIRVLEISEDKVFVVDCLKKSAPKWINKSTITDWKLCDLKELLTKTDKLLLDINSMDNASKKIVYEKYNLICGVLPFISNKAERCRAIEKVSQYYNVSKQTVNNYLWLYLVYQNISAFCKDSGTTEKELTADEKNMRWALNKYFYTKHKNSLNTAYTFMLKEKYCNSCGELQEKFPTFYQFRYFYRKYNKMQTYYISRDGIKNYQRNNRPLLGDNIQEFAPMVGVGMLDSTICDIYLINDMGNLVGRPILTACIDSYSSLCCGYSLTWEGGIYSLKNLMLNIIADKVKLCKKHGININIEDWNINMLPGTFITDKGSEYKSENFEQVAELGISIINLPAYRPELKGAVEKFFDLIQNYYKPYLRGKGVIESDFQERGAHDYRKDACLTLEDFENVILHCIIYYNSKRILEDFPYSVEMLSANVKPYANMIWNYGKMQSGANLIKVDSKQLILTLLPRTTAKFYRNGLKVNKLRYKNDSYTEMYLKGGNAIVAYNPDDVSNVWIIENGEYIMFELIEKRFIDKSVDDVANLQQEQSNIIKSAKNINLQAKIQLAEKIETISNIASSKCDTNIKNIRKTRRKEQKKMHLDFVKEGGINE